jgi:hypothetical protein
MNSDNQELIDDSYHNVTSKLESALSELETLINDVDSGIYDSDVNGFEDNDLLEVED